MTKEYYEANKDKIKTYSKMRNKTHGKEYYEANKDKIFQQRNKRRQSDPLVKLKRYLEVAIYNSLSRNKFQKQSSTLQILGCKLDEFKQHLELQFDPWMNWGNRGGRMVEGENTSWDIDHIIPISSAETEADIIRLNHYTNLRPLCSYYNRYVKRDN